MLEINCANCKRLVGRLQPKSSLAAGLRFVCPTCVDSHFPEFDRQEGVKGVGLKNTNPKQTDIPDFLKEIFGI